MPLFSCFSTGSALLSDLIELTPKNDHANILSIEIGTRTFGSRESFCMRQVINLSLIIIVGAPCVDFDFVDNCAVPKLLTSLPLVTNERAGEAFHSGRIIYFTMIIGRAIFGAIVNEEHSAARITHKPREKENLNIFQKWS